MRRISTSALVLALVLALPACIIVPHPMTRHIKGPDGDIKAGIDYKFIHPGDTKADEVRAKLKQVDTGYEHPRLFWARWCDSHSGITAAIGGPGAATGGTGRLWGARNLFVRFDEKGTATSVREFKDSELYAMLSAWVAEAKPAPLDVAKPVRFLVKHHEKVSFNSATITLAPQEISFVEDKTPAHSFTLKPEQLRSIDSTGHEDDENPRLTGQTLHFSTTTAVGSKLSVEMSARDLMDLAIYLRDQRK